MRAAIATKKIEIVAVNDPFLTTDYMVGSATFILMVHIEVRG